MIFPSISQPGQIAQNLHGTSKPKILLKKQKKKRSWIICKSRSTGITFRPNFKNKQLITEPKLIYVSYIVSSRTVAFFSENFSTRLFDMNYPYRYVGHHMHCKGLYLFSTINNALICNLRTKEVTTLPQGSKHFPRTELRGESEGLNTRVSFGFLQSTQAYKVAQFFFRSYNIEEKTYSMGFEFFTVGISKSWRVLARDLPYPLYSNCCSTFTGNCIYFSIWYLLAPCAPNAFLCIHLRNEKFSLLDPPLSLEHISVAMMILTGLHGSLCLSVMLMNNTKLSVFTTRQGRNFGWTPKFCFNVAPQPGRVFVMPIVEYGGKILIHETDKKSYKRLKLYDVKDGSFEEVNREVEDLKMRQKFRLYFGKPWLSVSYSEECQFRLVS